MTLETAVNFRDLGGYRAADGRTGRWRRPFRAADLSGLTEPDRSLVRTLGIATVIDLRSRAEVDIQRFPVDEIPVDFHHLPLVAALPRFEDFLAGPRFFSGHYLDIARDSGPQIARAVEIVADARTHPVVAGLAGYLLDTALDCHAQSPAARCGAIRTTAVEMTTTVLLVRHRFDLTLGRRREPDQALLADDHLAHLEQGVFEQCGVVGRGGDGGDHAATVRPGPHPSDRGQPHACRGPVGGPVGSGPPWRS